MEELLLAMMNQGFIVYVHKDIATLKKVSTPNNPILVRFDNGLPEIDCENVAAAIELAKKKMDWKCESKKSQFSWDMELTFKHRGFQQPRFASLGQINNLDQDAAIETAKQSAEVYLQKFKKNEIESWDVRVRPAKK